jgi:fusion and transport protein UGO1
MLRLTCTKGLLTASVTDALSSVIQPIMHNLLISIFPYTPQSSSLLVPVLSHLCTGVLLSPLDLVRTRLIAQSASVPFRMYTGPIDALSHILREEGGIKTIYLHPHLLFPAVLENTLRPFVTLSLPFIVGGSFGINEERTIGWMVMEFVASCAGLLITLPVETIRRRLQIQSRGKGKPLKSCVHTRRKGYHGIVDAFWKILSEECSDGRPFNSGLGTSSRHEQVRSHSWYSRHGLGQLYRGFGMGIGASTIVLVLAIVTGSYQSNTGWTEL